MQVTLDALGTRWWITLPDKYKNLESNIKSIITNFEKDYSRFINDSYIGKLNNSKSLENPSEELVNMLTYALDVYSQTDGIFNISIGSELEKSGYGKEADAKAIVSKNLLKDLKISHKQISLSEKTRIDLGGFGKGWLIEKLAGYLKHEGVTNFLINGGGDIASHGKAVNIYLEDPSDPTEYIGEVILHNNSLASSSNLKRTWESGGKKHMHIVHPSGNKLDGVLSMHVIADSILFADTFATIFLLVDRETRLRFATRYGFEFMEVLADSTTFRTQGFTFIPNID